MKNRFLSVPLLLAFAMVGLCACEKMVIDEDGKTPAANDGANLILRVTDSNAETMTTRADATYWKRLNFVAYQNGSKVKGVNQTLGDDGYGQAAMTLDPGTYQVLVLAHSSNNNPTLTSPDKIQFTNTDGFTDTFYYYGDITVGSEPRQHDITLQRATAMLRFTITDDMPSNVSQIHFYYTGGSGALNAKTGLGCVASKQSVYFDVDRSVGKPYTYEVYTMPREQAGGSLSLTVTALSASDNILKSREFSDVTVQCNRITEMKGTFFTDDPSDDPGGEKPSGETFSITANTQWGGTISLSY